MNHIQEQQDTICRMFRHFWVRSRKNKTNHRYCPNCKRVEIQKDTIPFGPTWFEINEYKEMKAKYNKEVSNA